MTAAEFERQASELRMSGLTVRQIAAKLGKSPTGTMKALNRALAKLQAESISNIDDWRTQELATLDRLQHALWPAAIKGKPGAIDRVLRIMERRARLLGLDAATAASIGVTGRDGKSLTVTFEF